MGDRPGPRHRTAGDQRSVLVHAGEDRIVRGAQPMPHGKPEPGPGSPAHGIDVPQGVHQTQGVDICRFGLQNIEIIDNAQRLGQQPGQFPAQRMQRVIPAEVKTQHPPIPDHHGSAHRHRLSPPAATGPVIEPRTRYRRRHRRPVR